MILIVYCCVQFPLLVEDFDEDVECRFLKKE